MGSRRLVAAPLEPKGVVTARRDVVSSEGSEALGVVRYVGELPGARILEHFVQKATIAGWGAKY